MTTLEAVREAHKLILPFIHRTPIMRCSALDALCGPGVELYLKCEHLQKAGSFKIRGAMHSVLRLSDEEAAKGVVTHSSGNHGQAVALAAKIRGIKATVVIPNNAPPVKAAAIRAYGANLVFCEPTLKSREETSAAIVAETQGFMIPPYNHANVIAGQGTIALEILEEVPDVDCIITPISGGGLTSGVTITAKALRPDIICVAAEPAGADDAFRSKASGTLQINEKVDTIADGLRVQQLGDITWPVIRDVLDAVVTVTDAEIVEAMRLLFERAKQVVEPSGAASVAVAMSKTFQDGPGAHKKKVVVVLSGGNLDLS
eukprot:CAMPEP_0114539310 /NCGR_PEP_ID=MMETSP0114-20121206/170_1 /TAXON_ID=31324 /ORGANISM="Goniomonas sp, Strain m" /LENGTH=315 /DNA_ID=CAMNT_0001723405 /DNA_START=9 /DNA_END=953 /DNA_ORIENTATION=+